MNFAEKLAFLILLVGLVFLFGFVTMFLVNFLFELNFTFWQGVALFLLGRVLFGNANFNNNN